MTRLFPVVVVVVVVVVVAAAAAVVVVVPRYAQVPWVGFSFRSRKTERGRGGGI